MTTESQHNGTLEVVVVDETGAGTRFGICYEPNDRIDDLISRLEREEEFDRAAAFEAAAALQHMTDSKQPLHEVRWQQGPVEVTCVLVEVHFETEVKEHRFPSKASWARVHHWACHAFRISTDACAHLELREDSPTGPALNERNHIGVHHGRKVVWLVKPGPEPNG